MRARAHTHTHLLLFPLLWLPRPGPLLFILFLRYTYFMCVDALPAWMFLHYVYAVPTVAKKDNGS